MLISPVSNKFYSAPLKLSFKGNNTTSSASSSEALDETASKQNNSPEIFIPTEQYIAMTVQGQLNKMEEAAKDPESNLSKYAKAMDEALGGIDFLDEGDGDEAEFLGNMSGGMADMTIFALESVTDGMQSVPDKLKGKIPQFFTSTADDYIKTMERNIAEQEAVDFSEIQIPDLDDLGDIAEFDGIEEKDKEIAAKLLEQTQQMFEDGTMATILEGQKALVETLKTAKYGELNNVLTKMNDRMNYMLYQAINAGFDRNPREVIDLLTLNSAMPVRPLVKDNGDGTSTYIYPGMSSLKIVKNNKNGDYISAECIKNGKPAIVVKFRENGSIELLNYVNSTDNSEISIETNTDNNMVRACKACEGGILERIFKKEDDGSLKQISAKVILQ